MNTHRGQRRSTLGYVVGLAACLLAACSSHTATPEVAGGMTATAARVDGTTTIAPSHTPRPSAIIAATQTIKPSASPTALLALNTRQPSLKQINDYMRTVFPDMHYFTQIEDTNTQATLFETQPFVPEDVSGDGIADLVAYDDITVPPTMNFALVYQDVSGDGELDMLFFGVVGLVVLRWDGGQYSEPFVIASPWSRGGGPTMRVTLADWTGDAGPEIAYDVSSLGGGSGLWIWYTERTLVHCHAAGCQPIWEGVYSIDTEDNGTGGEAHYRLEMKPVQETQGLPMLRTTDSGYSIYCCSEGGGLGHIESLSLYPSTLRLYTWTGDTFELVEEAIISQTQIIEARSVLSANSAAGARAEVVWEDNFSADRRNEACLLVINGDEVGDYFGCRHRFTTVEWIDLTADSQEELVVTAYSARNPIAGPSSDYAELGNEICSHQRLIVHSWNGVTAEELANVSGCVSRSDLFGVRLEDYDGDGQLEILAAAVSFDDSTPSLAERAYKWNGSRFVFWSEIP